MIDVQINGQSLRELLVDPPKLSDQLEAVCRTLDISIRNVPGIKNEKGQTVKLFYNGTLQFEGPLFNRRFDSSGNIVYRAFDPMIYMRNKDDYYFKNVTATQGIKNLAQRNGVKVGTIANTGAVLPPLYYPGREGDLVMLDMLARTRSLNKRKFWPRYVPGQGLTVFERVVPKKAWAFQLGINLTSAEYEDSIEETVTVVKLVNRETGKQVVKENAALKEKYGRLTYFEEVDKDEVNTMERRATNVLSSLGKVKATQSMEGINPDGTMPMFYSGDMVFVEEPYTGLIGAYYIEDITQTYISANLVEISASLTKAANVPEIQYDDARDKPDFLKTEEEKKREKGA